MLQVGCGVSKAENAFSAGVEAAGQARVGAGREPLSAVLVFVSVQYELDRLLDGIHSVLDGVPVFGCTTAGEICNGAHRGSVVVMALASRQLEVRTGLGHAVSQDWRRAVHEAIGEPAVQPYFSADGHDTWQRLTREGKSAFALLLSPGNTRQADSRSYEILEELKRLSDGRLLVIGGGAADDWRLEGNAVFLGRQVVPDGLLLAVFETRLAFGTALAHGFRPGRQRATVTRCDGHEVLELDGRLAADRYAEMLGRRRADLEAGHVTFLSGRPAGVLDPHGRHVINVASYLTGRGGVRFAQPVHTGATLAIMEADEESLIQAGQQALRQALLRGGVIEPAVVLVFSCALRSRLLGRQSSRELDGLADLAGGVPLVGFYSFGEQGLADDGVNRHQNLVISLLVLGRNLSYAGQVALENARLRQQLEATEAALRESEERFRNLFEHVPNLAIQGYRPDGTVVFWNRASQTLYGYTAAEAIGRPLADLIIPADVRPLFEQGLQMGRSAERTGEFMAPTEALLRHKDGRLIPVYSIHTVVCSPGREPMLFCIDVDLSERRQIEEQLRQAQKMEAIGQLAGGIAHDFNNLLTGIIGFANLLHSDSQPGTLAHEAAESIEKAAGRAAQLTTQLLGFARRGKYQAVPVDLHQTIREVVRLLERTFDKNIVIRFQPQADRAVVIGDPGQMQQVFVNLGLNARDAMPQGGLLTLATGEIDVEAAYCRTHVEARPGRHVRVSVIDTGCGVPAAIRHRIFEPFFTTKPAGQGSGMGLATVYGIVRNHGGWLHLESEEGRGATFHVYLPAVSEAGAIGRPEIPPVAVSSTGTVLVVDDEDVVLSTAAAMLRRLGHKVLTAASAREALACLRERRPPIDVVILDMVMPEMDGRQCFHALRQIDPHVPVVFSTGLGHDRQMQDLLKAEGVGFLQKPYCLEHLAAAVAEALKRTRTCPHANHRDRH